MTSIVRANKHHVQLLSEIAKQTFVESHGNSAASDDIDIYVTKNYSADIFKNELSDTKNIYHIIYHQNRAAGYSKIILDTPYSNSQIKNIAKLERLYLLKEFYNLQLGQQLFQFNINFSIKNNQKGIWLYVWKENQRALNFYKKNGFQIVGSHDFKISETHSNPNHQMFLYL